MIKTTETTKGVRRQKPSCSSVPSSETTVYYYSDNWQVLSTYVGGSLDKSFVYGNYIDEVLVMNHGADDYFYLHDHLYSPAVLFGSSGTVAVRYEYDAYGRRRQYTAGWVPSTAQIWGNYYAFTGRELDWLDGGNLQVMYYRARYYDTDTGRFLQRDPLGIDPAGGLRNPFYAQRQYIDGANIYEYAQSCPQLLTDPYGLNCSSPSTCRYPWGNDFDHNMCVLYCNFRFLIGEFNPLPGWEDVVEEILDSFWKSFWRHICNFAKIRRLGACLNTCNLWELGHGEDGSGYIPPGDPWE